MKSPKEIARDILEWRYNHSTPDEDMLTHIAEAIRTDREAVREACQKKCEELARILLKGEGNLSETARTHEHDACLIASGWLKTLDLSGKGEK